MGVDRLLHGPYELPKELQGIFESVRTSQMYAGGRSFVFKGLKLKTSLLHDPNFVVKYGRLTGNRVFSDKNLRNEVRVLSSTDHPGFPKLLYSNFDGNMPWLVLENGGLDLCEILFFENHLLTFDKSKRIAKSILNALAYFHSKQLLHGDLLHGDLKIDNVAVSGERAMILDFDSTSGPTGPGGRFCIHSTTHEYLPPEGLDGVSFSFDVFQLGLLFGLLFSERHFLGSVFFREHVIHSQSQLLSYNSSGSLYEENLNGIYHSNQLCVYLDDGYSVRFGHNGLEGLVAKATRRDPNERYQDAGEMLEHFLKVTA